MVGGRSGRKFGRELDVEGEIAILVALFSKSNVSILPP
jgi:hypothetical protein